MILRVLSDDQQKMAEALELLRPLGVEVTTAERPSFGELVSFYLARMNTKLDNLGQLRHLFQLNKLVGSIEKSQGVQSALDRNILEERMYRQRQNERLYDQLRAETGKHPLLRMKDDRYVTATDIRYMTEEQIRSLFS
jgi:hypothetical protein